METRALLVTAALDLGEAMLKCGAEVSRVEDTLRRIYTSYGAVDVDVLTITSCIILTVTFPEKVYTQTRRIRSSATDFHKLSRLNALSRDICRETPAPERICERLEVILSEKSGEKTRLIKKLLGSVLAAGGFTVFFGGGVFDFLFCTVMAVLMVVFEKLFRKESTNLPAYYFVCTFAVGSVTAILCRILPQIHRDEVMIGLIMLVIPGVAFTNSARDLLLGDTISGSLKMLESVLYAACIAGGIALALVLFAGGAV